MEWVDNLSRIVGWSKYSEYPWHFIKDPLLQWEELPTFLVGEYTFLTLALLSLVHACKHSRLHVFAWVMTFLIGTANDVFFMALPFVDNFWQAQATIMITPRLPLYIPCVYNAYVSTILVLLPCRRFMYWPVVASWRTPFSLAGKAALSGLLAGLTYGPYDMIGVKFLWWTWHDTYAGLRYRLLDVPVGSTLWTLTFVWSFSLLINLTTKEEKALGFGRMVFSFIICALFTTPLMMVIMGIFQLVGTEGLPSIPCLVVCVSLFAIVLGFNSVYHWRVHRKHPRDSDTLGRFAISLYVFGLTVIGVFGRPETHFSTGLHQKIGPCHVNQYDAITQTTHYEFLCPQEFSAVWNFDCTEIPKVRKSGPVEWYTVCGTAHMNYQLWLGVLLSAIILTLQFYVSIFRGKAPVLRSQKIKAY